jgi:hypothetical protein
MKLENMVMVPWWAPEKTRKQLSYHPWKKITMVSGFVSPFSRQEEQIKGSRGGPGPTPPSLIITGLCSHLLIPTLYSSHK